MLMTDISSARKLWIAVRSLVLAIALALLGGYLNELGTQMFPRREKYVDNVVALLIVIPMIYFVFVPFFRAFAHNQPAAQNNKVDG